jgi:hypothetical protein
MLSEKVYAAAVDVISLNLAQTDVTALDSQQLQLLIAA